MRVKTLHSKPFLSINLLSHFALLRALVSTNSCWKEPGVKREAGFQTREELGPYGRIIHRKKSFEMRIR
jgi:hypothetical protein